jgi:hypothetical protein
MPDHLGDDMRKVDDKDENKEEIKGKIKRIILIKNILI